MSKDKYQNKYRIPSNRWQGYDYGADGCYYVTICTKNRIHFTIMRNPDCYIGAFHPWGYAIRPYGRHPIPLGQWCEGINPPFQNKLDILYGNAIFTNTLSVMKNRINTLPTL